MLENIPMIAVKKMQMTEGVYSVNIEDLVSAFIDDEVALITGVIKSDRAAGDDRKFRIQGGAVYKENKLIGYLDEGETRMLCGRKGTSNNRCFPSGSNRKPASTAAPSVLRCSTALPTWIRNCSQQTVLYDPSERCAAKLLENNTDLDMEKEESLKIVSRKFTEQAEET